MINLKVDYLFPLMAHLVSGAELGTEDLKAVPGSDVKGLCSLLVALTLFARVEEVLPWVTLVTVTLVMGDTVALTGSCSSENRQNCTQFLSLHLTF